MIRSLIIKSSIFLSMLFFAVNAQAASLNIVPSQQSVSVGQNISVSFEVNSSDRAINAISGKIIYDKNLLQVRSVNKTDSIIKFWTQEPIVQSSVGSVALEGVILNPGFKGTRGRIVTVVFSAKKEGTVNLSIEDGNVLANDGAGTSVLETVGKAKILILANNEVVTDNNINPEVIIKPENKEDYPVFAEIPIESYIVEESVKFEIVDYPIEVKQHSTIAISGTGGVGKVNIYGVNMSNGKSSNSSVIYYRNIKKIDYDIVQNAKRVNGGYQSEFEINTDGKYAFYAKDETGNTSDIVFVEVGNSFWQDIWDFIRSWWWVGLIGIVFFASNWYFWKLGKATARY